MYKYLLDYLCSPLTNEQLVLTKYKGLKRSDYIVNDTLRSISTGEVYPIIHGVPLLKPPGDIADYSIEIDEILFGEKSNEINNDICKKVSTPHEFTEKINNYINTVLGKDGVVNYVIYY